MRRLLLIAVLAALSCCLYTASAYAEAPAKAVIRIKGSDDMAPRVNKLAYQFMQDNPNTNIVVSGGTKGLGFSALLAGDCEIFMSGHELTPEEKLAATEKGVQVAERLVGHGGLVLLTYPENTVTELTLAQIRELMKGNYTNWKRVDGPEQPVIFISIEDTDTDIRIFLLNNFLKIPGSHAKIARVINYQAAIRKAATTPGGLAYCRIRDIEISGAVGEAKILKVKKESDSPAVLPSRETIADGSYSLQRPFFLCTTNKAAPETLKFVDFVAAGGWGGEIK